MRRVLDSHGASLGRRDRARIRPKSSARVRMRHGCSRPAAAVRSRPMEAVRQLALDPARLDEIALVGDGLPGPCLDGRERPYLNLDCAASTSALPALAGRVAALLPWYSSVHRG